MEQEIIVKEVMQKTSKNGKVYTFVKSDLGNFSCWDNEKAKRLMPNQKYIVITETKNGFNNILDVIGDMGFVTANQIKEPFKDAREDKAHLMLVAYIKDQVVACINAGATRGTDFDVNALWELAYKNVTDAYKKLKEELK